MSAAPTEEPAMQIATESPKPMSPITTERATSQAYRRAVLASKRVRWDIDADVLRGRTLDGDLKYLPDGLSLIASLDFLSEAERRIASRVQGRSYANIFGLVERFINTKVLELGHDHALEDQDVVEALVRFSDEELKHQELFRRIELLAERAMPPGYRFVAKPNDVARAVLSKSTWGVLALTCHIELFTLAHYRHSIEKDDALSPLWKDVFRFHFLEESQHAIIDELEWLREHERLDAAGRDRGVDDLIALVGAVDGILQAQAKADAEYLVALVARPLSDAERETMDAWFLKAYRYQYITSGLQMTRFADVLRGLITEAQRARVDAALAPLF
jgi:hypothetical protein